MYKIILSSIIVASSSLLLAFNNHIRYENTAQKSFSIDKNDQQCEMKFQQSSNQDLESSGCCSHHGGVCGCSGKRATCCDGSISPSCGCY